MRSLSIAVLIAFVGCQDGANSLFPKAERPLPEKLVKAMKAKGMTSHSPILVRIFKEENALEVWKQKNTGRYDLLETYEICKWSGKLGPKFKEGDRQAPEGFYTVAPAQMNPKSSYHLSFNMGYPNQFDRSHGRTGSHLMVHGACSSAGCYSMTDELVEEIYSLARDSFKGGQRKFQIQAYPFRMTPENMVRHEGSKHYAFWQTLKKGNDHFELTKSPPKIDVCDRNYVFNREVEEGEKFISNAACPPSSMPASLEQAYLKKFLADNEEMSEIRAKAEKKEKLNALLNPPKAAEPDPVVGGPVTASIETDAQTVKLQSNALPTPQLNPEQTDVIPLAQPNIPQPRPAIDVQQEPVKEKKPGGFLSFLKRK